MMTLPAMMTATQMTTVSNEPLTSENCYVSLASQIIIIIFPYEYWTLLTWSKFYSLLMLTLQIILNIAIFMLC